MIDKLLIPKAYVEVLEILKYIPEADYKKVPNEIIENMKKNVDKDYKYIVTRFEDFQEQAILRETETILAVLFRDYWATEDQQKKILEKEQYDLKVLEEAKREQYNPDDIFKNANKAKNTDIEMSENNTNTALIECKGSFFTRFKNFIFKILHINK